MSKLRRRISRRLIWLGVPATVVALVLALLYGDEPLPPELFLDLPAESQVDDPDNPWRSTLARWPSERAFLSDVGVDADSWSTFSVSDYYWTGLYEQPRSPQLVLRAIREFEGDHSDLVGRDRPEFKKHQRVAAATRSPMLKRLQKKL